MSTSRASADSALRMRASLAAILGLQLTGCDHGARQESDATPKPQPVVTVAVPEPQAPDPELTVAEPEPTVDKPEPPPGQKRPAGQPGWIRDGYYCVHLVDTRPTPESHDEQTGCGYDRSHLEDIEPTPSGMHAFVLDQLATKNERAEVADACCFDVARTIRGRPLRRPDEERSVLTAPSATRHDWQAAVIFEVASLDRAERRATAAKWAEVAALEHASVAEFSRLALALLGLGAPPQLVAGAQQAALDEVSHARTSYGIASRLSGRSLGPGNLDVGDVSAAIDRVALVRETLEDGCVGECLAALELAVASRTTEEPALAEALAAMADDETRHAELAYAIVAWALATASAEERATLDHALCEAIESLERRLAEPAPGGKEGRTRLGLLADEDRLRVQHDGLRLAVLPALRALATGLT